VCIYIPENDYGIEWRHYDLDEFCNLLREHKGNPEIVQFLADMLER